MSQTLFGPRDVGTVLMDPPWLERGGGKIKRGADRHYPLVPTPELPAVIRSCDHWDRLADDAHCYMWVTNNFLADGLWLLEQLGFRYVTNLVWVKKQFGIGYYFRGMETAGAHRRRVREEQRLAVLGSPAVRHSTNEHGECPHWCEACRVERDQRDAEASDLRALAERESE